MVVKKKLLLTRELNLSVNAEERLKSKVDVVLSTGQHEKDLLPLVQDIHGIIAHGTAISENIIRAAPLLQVIATPNT